MDEESDDLRTVLRAFRASVSHELATVNTRMDSLEGRMDHLEGRMDALEGRMTELRDEVRTRTITMETAILNSLRDLGQEMARGFERGERWWDDHERRLRRLEGNEPA